MAIDKSEIMNWSDEEKRTLAFELLDSIDEKTIKQPLPKWKENLIRQRIEKDEQAGDDIIEWNILRDKYSR